MENRTVRYNKYEYERWSNKRDKVNKIVAQQWDLWLTEFGYDTKINVLELQEGTYKFICTQIDRILEPYFTGFNALYIRNGWLPGWNYQGRHL